MPMWGTRIRDLPFKLVVQSEIDRIDLVVALIIAWGRAIFAEPQFDEPRITVIGGSDD